MPKYQSDNLNQYQQSNQEILNPEILRCLQQGDWRNAPTLILKCVCCGQNHITMPIVEYFNYDPTQLLCYGCQNEIYGHQRIQQGAN
jgi:hypothetical protein